MKKQCNYCGIYLDNLLPFKCKYCGGLYCKDHCLPENHNCPNLPHRGTLIKNQYNPSKYHETTNFSVPVQISERRNHHKNYHRNDREYSSFKYSTKKMLIKMLKNKWFWIIGLPIILLIIFYVFMWMSYGKEIADLIIIFLFFTIIMIIVMILMPKKKRYDPLREAIYQEELIREKARQDVRRGRRW